MVPYSRSILSLIFWVVLRLATLDSSSNAKSGADQAANPADVPSDDVSTAVLFDVAGTTTSRKHPMGFCMSIAKGKLLYGIRPSTGETLTERAGSIFGIEWHDGDIYYTTSVHRQEGHSFAWMATPVKYWPPPPVMPFSRTHRPLPSARRHLGADGQNGRSPVRGRWQ